MWSSVEQGAWWTPFSWRLRAITWLRIMACVLASIHFAWVIGLAVTDNYTMSAFTLWSFTMLASFHVALVVAVFTQGLPLTLVIMIGLPLVIGTVMPVCGGIIVFILDNAGLLTDNTTCDPNAPFDARSMGLTNAGNWVEHGWPVLDVILLLVAGGQYFGQYIIVRTLHDWRSISRALYFIYFQLCPFVLLIIFDATLSFGRTYPTSFSWWARTGIAVAFIIPTQLFLWFSFTTVTHYDQISPYWIADWSNMQWGDLLQGAKRTYTPQELRLAREIVRAHRNISRSYEELSSAVEQSEQQQFTNDVHGCDDIEDF